MIGGFVGGVEEFVKVNWTVAVDETDVVAHGDLDTCVRHVTEADNCTRTLGAAELCLIHDFGNKVMRWSIGEAEHGICRR